MTNNPFENSTGSCGPSFWPCCGVTAVAVVAGRSFNEVFAHMGRDKRKDWKGITYFPERMATLRHYGVQLGQSFFYGVFDPRKYKCRRRFDAWQRSARPGVTYIVDVTGHSMVYRDGFLIDQSNPAGIPWRQHRAAKKFLWTVTEIKG